MPKFMAAATVLPANRKANQKPATVPHLSRFGSGANKCDLAHKVLY